MLTILFVRYEIENGNKFRGSTWKLADISLIYIMAGADNILYWVEFTRDEYENRPYLTKSVRLGEFIMI